MSQNRSGKSGKDLILKVPLGTQVFEEDQVILNEQQKRISAMPHAPEIDINSDAPNIQVRRLMDELISAEQAELRGRRRRA